MTVEQEVKACAERYARGEMPRQKAAEQVLQLVEQRPGVRICIVAADHHIGRHILAHELMQAAIRRCTIGVKYVASRCELRFANGSVAQLYSAQAPDALRGPEYDASWVDDIRAGGRKPPCRIEWKEMPDGERVKVEGEPLIRENLRLAVRPREGFGPAVRIYS